MTPKLIARIEAMIEERVDVWSDDGFPTVESIRRVLTANYELGYLDAILRCDGLPDKTAEALWPCLVEGFTP